MKSILISLLIQVIKQLIGSTNWAEIFQAVADAALTPGLSGAERRRALDRIETEVEAVATHWSTSLLRRRCSSSNRKKPADPGTREMIETVVIVGGNLGRGLHRHRPCPAVDWLSESRTVLPGFRVSAFRTPPGYASRLAAQTKVAD